MRRPCAVLLALAALGACALIEPEPAPAPEQPAPAPPQAALPPPSALTPPPSGPPRPTRKPTPPPASAAPSPSVPGGTSPGLIDRADPERVIGMTQPEVHAWLGEPTLRIEEAPATRW